jgi:hypothetical protein
MASKKTKAPAADDDFDNLFDGIPSNSTSKATKPTSAASKALGDKDPLAGLESLAGEDLSRPHTPRVKDVAARRSTATPPIGDVARQSTDSARSLKTTLTPSATSSELHEAEVKAPVEQTQPTAQEAQQAAGGGWWGGFMSTASAAMKQAEAAYKEIQQNEEAKKWAEQVRGNVGTLRTYGKPRRSFNVVTILRMMLIMYIR